MTQTTLFITLVAICLITRLGPLAFSKWLKRQHWIEKLGKFLPIMILVLLIIHDTEARFISSDLSTLGTVVGLTATFLIHHWKKCTIFSIICGVITYSLTSMVF